jgi:hypothetical protein
MMEQNIPINLMLLRMVFLYIKDAGIVSIITLRYLTLVLALLFVFSIQKADAQINVHDTSEVIEKLVEETDTMVRREIWSQPIDSLILKKNNTRIKKELYNLIFREKSGQNKVKEPEEIKNIMFDGKIIRNISFHNVNIFAHDVADTGYISANWFQKNFDSKYHSTRQDVLEQYLLLNPGDKLDVFLVAENERILRDLSFIMDARFIFRPVEGSPDSVDLLLLTQDKFPIGLEADFEKSSIASLGIAYHNLFGYGQRLTTTSYYSAQEQPRFGYSLSYGTSNVSGTFVSSRLSYIHTWNQESYMLDFSRDFRAINFRNAGGISYENTAIEKNIELLDTTYVHALWKYSLTDIWAGRIIRLFYNSPEMRSGLFVAGRIKQYENYKLPAIGDAYLYPYRNNVLLLASTGISAQGFRKDNMIYTFGRTEDVPFGYIFDLATGVEWNEDNRRLYISPGAAYGTYLRNSSYCYGQIRYGTFLHNGETEQGALKLQLLYFSPLHGNFRFRYRSFVTFTYVKGMNRFPGEYISVGNQGGVMGLTSPAMRGTEKYVLSLESVLFSPYEVLGFHFAFFGDIDLGLIQQENTKFADSRLFSGISMGVRIRNDKLVFDTFVIKIAFYPGKPSDAVPQNFILDNMSKSRFNDFFPYRPATVNYQ